MSPERLTQALHHIRHDRGDLWPVSGGCGCQQWAAAIIERCPPSPREVWTEKVVDATRRLYQHRLAEYPGQRARAEAYWRLDDEIAALMEEEPT